MNKDSFILYTSQYEAIKGLTLEQKGALLDALYKYSLGEEITQTDPLVFLAFSFIRISLDANAAAYAEKCERLRAAGKKGGIAKAENVANAKNEVANVANATNAKNEVANASKCYLYDNDNENIYNDILFNEDEEEDARTRAGNFQKIWNEYAERSGVMKKSKHLPIDAGERLKKAQNHIVAKVLNTKAARAAVYAAAGFSMPETATPEQAAGYFILIAMKKLQSVQIKSKASNFGTLAWFLKPDIIIKLYNGEIA